MNAERLLAQFERISEAPDAIARLRRFILDLAVRGKLVEQDPEDEPAEELLYRIQEQKKRMVLSGEIKKPKEGLSVSSAAQSPQLPQGWTLCRLDEASICLDYKREPVNGAERHKRIEGKLQEQLFPYFGATQQQGWIDDYLFDDELVLLGEDGVPFFDFLRTKAYVISGKTWVNNHAHVFKPILSEAGYLVHCLNIFDYSGRVAGATRSKLNQAKAVDIPILLPPLAEQHRIVAKVDELMALCDQLEAARQQREHGRERLVAATLQRLNQTAEDPASFRQDASFALQVLPSLTTTPAQIKQLRQTILNLAVRGKLVAQDPEDEPAEEQLERITLAKLALGRKERAFKKEKPDMLIESFQFLLPSGWVSATLADLVTILNGRAYKQSELLDSGTPVLRVGNLFTSNKWYYSNLELDDDKCIDDGDLIFAWSASFGPFIWKGGRVIYHYHIWKLPLHSPADLSRDYLYLYLLHKTAEIKGAGHGISMVHMTKEKMEGLEVPLPPLAEQHRIVAKVDELTALCDQLEQQLSQADQQRSRLLEAVLAEALQTSKPALGSESIV